MTAVTCCSIPDNRISIAPQCNEDWVMEIRMQQYGVTERSKDVLREVYAEYDSVFGAITAPTRSSKSNMTEDADIVLWVWARSPCRLKVAVSHSARTGQEGRFVRLRWFRPFPARNCAAVPQPVQGRGRHRPRYSLGSPYLSGRRGYRSAYRTVSRHKAPKPPVLGFHLRSRRREVYEADIEKMTAACFDAAAGKPQPLTSMDRGAEVIPAPGRMSEK